MRRGGCEKHDRLHPRVVLPPLDDHHHLDHVKGPFESREMPGDFESQARLTFRNLEVALQAAGLGWEDVIKMMVIVKRREDYARMNAIRKELFEDIPMASTTFVAELIREDMLIEVDVWAVAP